MRDVLHIQSGSRGGGMWAGPRLVHLGRGTCPRLRPGARSTPPCHQDPPLKALTTLSSPPLLFESRRSQVSYLVELSQGLRTPSPAPAAHTASSFTVSLPELVDFCLDTADLSGFSAQRGERSSR